ncbi:stalk domain-containing protein [Paenibacillus oryzisoli]|nr:stalk domain-containing protein [Paenibacillus oryzisoli]
MRNKLITSLVLMASILVPTNSMANGTLIEDARLESAIKSKLNVTELTKENLSELQYLLIYKDNNIKSLNGMEYATNLGQFLVQYNQISDLKPIANLTNLWFLSLNHNEITDISAVANLKRLNTLGLDFNNIIDIRALKGLKIGSLSLESNPYLKDISVMNQMQNIHKLDLANTSVADLTPLIHHPINSLNICDTEISDLSPLTKIQSLKTLYLKNLPLDTRAEEVLTLLKDKGVEIVVPDELMSKSNIKVNGEIQKFDVAPTLSYVRTMMPMRTIFELLGAEVSWDEKTKSILAKTNTNVVSLTLGSRKVVVNDKDFYFEVKPQLYKDTTMVPLRFITETLGASLEWEELTSTINIKTK